jgi:hypothetical protein
MRRDRAARDVVVGGSLGMSCWAADESLGAGGGTKPTSSGQRSKWWAMVRDWRRRDKKGKYKRAR